MNTEHSDKDKCQPMKKGQALFYNFSGITNIDKPHNKILFICVLSSLYVVPTKHKSQMEKSSLWECEHPGCDEIKTVIEMLL